MLSPKKVASAIATSALIFNALTSTAFAANTVTVTGNGDSSQNGVSISNNQQNQVTQNNNAVVTNSISSNANTGGNDANRNTGGNVSVDTGNAATKTTVTNSLNSNHADLSNCNCGSDTQVVIAGNGVKSTNGVNVANTNNSGTTLFQNNAAVVTNSAQSNANTGNNDANRNTGGVGVNAPGNINVSTGDAYVETNVSTHANANVASVGGNGAVLPGAGNQASIIGNGDSSKNAIALADNHATLVVQNNSAYVSNGVSSNANTGDNDANRNTGANVTVDTGNAGTKTNIDNMVNFNAANVDCDCVLGDGIAVKIAGNGVDSNNAVSSVDNNGFKIFQGGENAGNQALLANAIDANADSGANDANRNTGAVVGFDPVDVMTGDSASVNNVNNSGNTNVVGSPLPLLGTNLVFSWNFGSLWGWL